MEWYDNDGRSKPTWKSKQHQSRTCNGLDENPKNKHDGLVQIDIEKAGIDMRAMAIAQQLMLANNTQNRQSHAASTSALFNLVMQASLKHDEIAQPPKQSQVCPTIATAQLAQDAISKHLGRMGKEPCKTLADGLKITRKHLPQDLSRKLQELNSAGSYDRHHGATVNQRLLDELGAALSALEFIDEQTIPKESHPVCDADDVAYAFTAAEPTRLDTGTEYIKLPLGTYVKVQNASDDTCEVLRLTGIGLEKDRQGKVPRSSLTFVPLEYIPTYILYSDRFHGKTVNIRHDGLDFSDRPYLDAGPKSQRLDTGAVLKIRDVNQEFANVNLLGHDGQSEAFGKIRLNDLKYATLSDTGEQK